MKNNAKQKKILFGSRITMIILTGIIMFLSFGCGNTNSRNSQKSVYIEYLKKVKRTVLELSEDQKLKREEAISKLEQNEIYITLVDSKIVSVDYIPLINAIANGTSYINDKGFSADQTLLDRIKKQVNGEIKLKFVLTSISLAQPQRGGFSKELVEVFERYKERFKYYGEAGIVYNANGQQLGEIEYDYDFSPIFGVLDSENEDVLNAIYEAKNKGLSNWNEDADYIYNFIATKSGYNKYVKKVYPKSSYVLNVDYEITTHQLYQEYEENEIAADNKFKNKKIAVTGVISNISEVLGEIKVDLKSGDSVGWTNISCTMKDRDAVSELRKGQKLTIVGTCEGLTLNISINLTNCVIWEYI